MYKLTTTSPLGELTTSLMSFNSIYQKTPFNKKVSKSLKLFVVMVMICMTQNLNAQISYDSYSAENKSKLEVIDNQINAIRVKRDFLLSDPVKKSEAESMGWFSDSRRTLWQLFAQKRAIIKEETGKNFFSTEEFAELSAEKQQAVIDQGDALVE